jgi:hypothetical protein
LRRRNLAKGLDGRVLMFAADFAQTLLTVTGGQDRWDKLTSSLSD